jgi:hypothetical protein
MGGIRDHATRRGAGEIEVLPVNTPLRAIERKMVEILREEVGPEQAFGRRRSPDRLRL